MSEIKKEYEKTRNKAWIFAVLAIAFSVFMWFVTGPSMLTTNLVMSFIIAVPISGLFLVGWLAHKAAQDG